MTQKGMKRDYDDKTLGMACFNLELEVSQTSYCSFSIKTTKVPAYWLPVHTLIEER